MKYSIVKNGLWGTRALDRSDFDGSRGGLYNTNLNDARPYNGPTMEEIEQMLEGIEDRTPRERNIVLHTGPEGMRQFDLAMQAEAERQTLLHIEDEAGHWSRRPIITGTGGNINQQGTTTQFEQLWNQVRNSEEPQIEYVDPISNANIPRYVGGIDPISEDSPVFTQRVGTTDTRDINYMRLQRGDISTLEYLDLISEEE